VPTLGDFLSRFRAIGAPGSASRPGVPADRAGELRAELAPVFAMLAAADAQCAATIADGRQTAAQVAGDAADQAARIAADGRERAEAARATAASGVLAAAAAMAERERRAAAADVPARPAEEDVIALIDAAVSFVVSMPPDGAAA
jgi:hypothetical protein